MNSQIKFDCNEDLVNISEFIASLLGNVTSSMETLEIISSIRKELKYKDIEDEQEEGPWDSWDTTILSHYHGISPELRKLACNAVFERIKKEQEKQKQKKQKI